MIYHLKKKIYSLEQDRNEHAGRINQLYKIITSSAYRENFRNVIGSKSDEGDSESGDLDLSGVEKKPN